MEIGRREAIIGMAGLAGWQLTSCSSNNSNQKLEINMYGLIAKMTAVKGKREQLSTILVNGTRGMPGNISYMVANDLSNDTDLWITELWADKVAHANSLTLTTVQDAILAARPLIAKMERVAETQPLGTEN